MNDGKNTQRRRGVRASRVKLTHALTAAGLRTQAALAERIADIEDLDVAPKDIVNRVFREVPVDPMTLERVARALHVETHTLYKTTDENEVPATVPSDMVQRRKPGPLPAAFFALLALAVLGILGWYIATVWQPPLATAVTEKANTVPAQPLGLGTPTLVVLEFDGDERGALSAVVRQILGDYFNVATDTASALTESLNVQDVAGRLRADVVIEGNIVSVGRLSGIRIYLFSNGVRRQIWAQSLPTVALADGQKQIAERVSIAVRRATGLPVPGVVAPHFPLAPVQDDYLQGEYYRDRPLNELNIKRAQSRFEAALRHDANYARAHAGLCQSLLDELWMDNEERALKDAARTCGQALQLNPDDPVVSAAHAHFLRRTGRNDDAIALYERIVASEPKYASASAGLASSLLDAYRQTGDHDYLVRAKAMAQASANADPLIWQPLFALATMEWFDNNVAGAIAAGEAAIARDENEFVLGNLGTMYLCDGDYEKARDSYLRARELAPQSYVGDEFLGMAYYFLGDFEESVKLRQRAVDGIATGDPEIHEMWGNLGDSYRQTGNKGAAIKAYVRAAEIAERDHLRGNATVADRAARAYYYTRLQGLDPSTVPEAVTRRINDEIDGIAGELQSASAHRRMAETYLQRGEVEKARGAYARATKTCKGFGGLPDLAPLRQSADHR